jgi:hypothetical protein
MKLNKKNLTKFLAKIPLLSLSVVSLNFAPAAMATTVIPENTRTSATLIAQQATCNVVNIRTGQLAVRFSPNGKSRAGLDNGNTVALLRQGSSPWVYVRVIDGPSRGVNGLEGWVNSNYLSCGQASEAPAEVSCTVVNIRTGQLALRFTPNGQSKAGLNNGNTMDYLQRSSGSWSYVRVTEGPNSRVNGMEGWVNSNYLSCND